MNLGHTPFVRIVTLACFLTATACDNTDSPDADADVGVDAAMQTDAGHDAGTDSGPADAGTDTGPVLFECWEGSEAPPAVYARREAVSDDYHGENVVDPYRWLESNNAEREEHLARSQAATEGYLSPLAAAQVERLSELQLSRETILATQYGDVEFFQIRPPGEQRRAIYVRPEDGTGEGRLLINPNDWPDEVTLGEWEPSPDGRFVLFLESMNNSDAGVIFVMDVASGDVLDGGMMSPRLSFMSAEWALDSTGFYYWSQGPDSANQFYHVLNTPIGDDVNVSDTPSGRGSVEEALDGAERLLSTNNRLYRQDLGVTPRAESEYTLLIDPQSETQNFTYYGDSTRIYAEEQSFIRPRGAVWIANDGPATTWEPLIHQGEGALQSWIPFGDGAIGVFIEDGMSVVRAFRAGGVELAVAPIPDFGTANFAGIHGDEVGIYFEGIFESPRIFAWNPLSGAFSVLTMSDDAVSLPREDYDREVLSVSGRRSAGILDPQIHVPLVSPRGAPRDGTTPTFLNAYGGFFVASTPHFSPRQALWLEAGGALALPQLRGGSEQGLNWWLEAMAERKQVTYDDLYRVAEELSASGLTGPDHLVINGASNGGLTMSVAITQRPELFAAAAIEAPLTDMMRFQNSGTGWAWVDEYGSSDSELQFEYLRRYSPLHVAEELGCIDYPATIIMTGRADDRVVPWHAYKMAATLAERTTYRPTVLFTTESGSHAGSAFENENLAADVALLSFVAEASGLALF